MQPRISFLVLCEQMNQIPGVKTPLVIEQVLFYFA